MPPTTPIYKPWNLITYLAFNEKDRALLFEKYLKSHSGIAFANKRLGDKSGYFKKKLVP